MIQLKKYIVPFVFLAFVAFSYLFDFEVFSAPYFNFATRFYCPRIFYGMVPSE
jgi:hypothetical protein